MPTVDVYKMNKKKAGKAELSDGVFDAESRQHIYYDVVRGQLLSRRRGTAKTKKRSEVAGSTRKVYKQKGTGRARHGDSRSPLYKRGGAVFGPQPRNWETRIPRKVKRAALKSAISDRLREGHLLVIDAMDLKAIKTKEIAEFLGRFELSSALLVDVDNRSLSLSCRNLPNAKYLAAKGLNLFDVLKYDHLVLSKQAVEAIEGALKP
ncbi:MAG: 50S ribosomal protein L4 [Deltaproteobacteria bacterium]|nr:50S ribosomal protein L4 [Deltaproteobacteria bacterium]